MSFDEIKIIELFIFFIDLSNISKKLFGSPDMTSNRIIVHLL